MVFFHIFEYIRKPCNKSQRSYNLKTQICSRNEQNRNRDLFMWLYSLQYLKYLCLEIASGYGVVVSTLDFKPIDCRFESWSRQALFLFFSPKNETRPEEIYGNERVGEI